MRPGCTASRRPFHGWEIGLELCEDKDALVSDDKKGIQQTWTRLRSAIVVEA